MPLKIRGKGLGLLTAELKQKHPTGPQESGALPHHPPENLGAIATAVVGERRSKASVSRGSTVKAGVGT